MLKLNMNTSTVIIYDSACDDLRKSPYFDYPLIAHIIQNMHNYYKTERNMPTKQLQFFDQSIMHQSGSDCGCHTLINIELLLRRKDPTPQTFNTELIRKIRKYHFLLANKFLHEFRLDV